jgi:SAM-dependent methyltransferase
MRSNLDNPSTTEINKSIIQNKKYLKCIYTEYYKLIASEISKNQKILELGSGGSFLKNFLPQLITSDILLLNGIDLVIDAQNMDVESESLDGIVMVDVLHHIPDVTLFFNQAKRVLKDQGKIVMVEPWNSKWSYFIYKYIHHEDFNPHTNSWSFDSSGPLSGANGALPWIVFERDIEIFRHKYPEFILNRIDKFMPFSYILSGGLSYNYSFPHKLYKFIRTIENKIFNNKFSMFCFICLKYSPK